MKENIKLNINGELLSQIAVNLNYGAEEILKVLKNNDMSLFLSEKEIKILNLRYETNEGKLRTYKSISEETGISSSHARQLNEKAIFKLRRVIINHDNLPQLIKVEKLNLSSDTYNYLKKRYIYTLKSILNFSSDQLKELKKENNSIYNEIIKKIQQLDYEFYFMKVDEFLNDKSISKHLIKIEYLCLSNKAFLALKRGSINNLEHLLMSNRYELYIMCNRDKVIYNEILNKIHQLGYEFSGIDQLFDKDIPTEKIRIEYLNLSNRVYYSLKRKGLSNLSQVLNCEKKELLKTKNFGEVSYRELLEKIHDLGYNFNWENNEKEKVKVKSYINYC